MQEIKRSVSQTESKYRIIQSEVPNKDMAIGGLILFSSAPMNLISRVRQSLQIARKHLFGVVYVYSWNHQNLQQDERNHFSHLTSAFYSQATLYCPNLDVRVLQQIPVKKDLSQSLGIILVEKELTSLSCKVEEFAKKNFPLTGDPQVIEISSEGGSTGSSEGTISNGDKEIKKYDVVALGGTFDRMHNAHKILLSEAILRCNKEIIVGVTDDSMIKSKCDLYHESPNFEINF